MYGEGIPGKWIYENMGSIPARAFINAVIVTDKGYRLKIRYWDSGRAGEAEVLVESLGSSPVRSGPYGVRAFENGFFKFLIPSKDFETNFLGFVESNRHRQIETRSQHYINISSTLGGHEPTSGSSVHHDANCLKTAKEADRQRIRNAAKEQRLHQESLIQKANSESAARRFIADPQLNDSRKFDLLIFDLDDTLLSTEHLDGFRGQEFAGPQNAQYKTELAEHARTLDHLIPENFLLLLQRDFPNLALSVFTRAPKVYADILIKTCFPKVQWSSIVAFEDVAHTKPRPDGIRLAARKLNIRDEKRIALVGDSKSDLIAAYQAGVTAVLLTAGWEPNWSNRNHPNRGDRFKAINLMPDAIVASYGDLRNLITNPVHMLPCLEAWDADSALNQSPELMRVDAHKHFNNLQDAGYPNWIDVHAMGRYFPSSTSRGWYDFTMREHHHSVTMAILNAKEGIPYPESWTECCTNLIAGYAFDASQKGQSILVCTIPSSSGSIRPAGRDRLVDLLKQIEPRLKNFKNVAIKYEVLQYTPGASSNKTLDRDSRFANVRDHMFVACPSTVDGMEVLVIDDVSTSGATFFYASRYLTQAGAYSVRCLALTQTIS